MTAPRASIPDFSLANPIYVGATVTFYTADSSGVVTTTLATLYSTQTGSVELANPQTLDSEGKLQQPIYISTAVIASVSNANGVADHSTGVIGRAQELSGSVAFTRPSLTAGATAQATITVTGAAVDDFAIGSFSIGHTDITIDAVLTSTNTATLTFRNVSGVTVAASVAGAAYVRVLKR